MPRPETSLPDAPPASITPSAPLADAPRMRCAACRPRDHWWRPYREGLLTTETQASLIGLVSLFTGWVVAWSGFHFSRWFYLAAAIVAGVPILRSCIASLRERRISVEVLVALAILTSLGVGEFHAG